MSEANVGRNRPAGAGRPSLKIEVMDLETGTKNNYDSIGEAARALNIECSIISNYFKNNQQKPYKNRYILKQI
jgi:hypothetical protein